MVRCYDDLAISLQYKCQNPASSRNSFFFVKLSEALGYGSSSSLHSYWECYTVFYVKLSFKKRVAFRMTKKSMDRLESVWRRSLRFLVSATKWISVLNRSTWMRQGSNHCGASCPLCCTLRNNYRLCSCKNYLIHIAVCGESEKLFKKSCYVLCIFLWVRSDGRVAQWEDEPLEQLPHTWSTCRSQLRTNQVHYTSGVAILVPVEPGRPKS